MILIAWIVGVVIVAILVQRVVILGLLGLGAVGVLPFRKRPTHSPTDNNDHKSDG